MDMKKIGGFLKLLRKERGLTQEQAGEIFMVAGRTISRWGKRREYAGFKPVDPDCRIL